MSAAPTDNADRVLLRLENVSKTFQMGEVAVEALRDVSLDVFAGEFLVMVGPSGSGKTTILNLVGGLDSVTSGRVWFADREITAFTPGELTRYRRDTVGFVFQFYNLVPNLTARENVMVSTELSRQPMDVAEALRDGRAGGPARPFPLAAFRRRAAARGHRPGPGQEPRPAAVRRADRGTGFHHRQAGAADAGRLEAAVGQERSS